VIAGGTEKTSMATRRGDGPLMMDSGNLRLRAKHPQSHRGVCADAIATLEGISREDTDRLALLSQQRAAAAKEISSSARYAFPAACIDHASPSQGD
jgi:acetyl-CoA C-acetyltransferase